MIRSYGYRNALLAIGSAALLAPSLAHAQLFTLSKEDLTAYTSQNPFDRLPDGRPKVPDSIIERAKGMSSEEVWAVLPGKGFRNQYADGFQISHPELKLAGRAFTVQFMPVRPDLCTLGHTIHVGARTAPARSASPIPRRPPARPARPAPRSAPVPRPPRMWCRPLRRSTPRPLTSDPRTRAA